MASLPCSFSIGIPKDMNAFSFFINPLLHIQTSNTTATMMLTVVRTKPMAMVPFVLRPLFIFLLLDSGMGGPELVAFDSDRSAVDGLVAVFVLNPSSSFLLLDYGIGGSGLDPIGLD